MQDIILHNLESINDFIDSLDEQDLLPVQQWKELLKLASYRKENVVFIALFNKKLKAGALFCEDTRRVATLSNKSLFLYGYEFFDFNPIYICKGYEKSYISTLKNYATFNNIKWLIFENLYQKTKLNSYYSVEEKINLFDEDVESFTSLYSKKGIKRHRKKVVDNFNYSVRHLTDSEITDEHIDRLEKLHKERWSFDDVSSSFNEEKRKTFFSTNKKNKLLTIIYASDEVIAMHFGILSKHSLLFHTPVINIKFYPFSPMSLIMYELAFYCHQNNLKELNFGLGEESYKSRFSNKTNSVFSYYFPLGFLNKFMFSVFFILSKKQKIIRASVGNIKNVIRYVLSQKNRVNFYRYEVKSNLISNRNDLSFLKINDYSSLVDEFRKSNIIVKRYHYKRMKNGDVFYCLKTENQIVSYGWSTSKPLYVSEKNKVFSKPNSYILYDFFTLLSHRNSGLYQYLLKNILSILDEGKYAYIYALSTNVPSNRAILKIGFKKIKSKFVFNA